MSLLCSNLGTVNLLLHRVESGPVSKPRIKLLRSGTTLSSDGFERTLFETSRWDTLGIHSVLRRTNGSEPAVYSFPTFDRLYPTLACLGPAFRISNLTLTSARLAIISFHFRRELKGAA